MNTADCLKALFPETRRILLHSILKSAEKRWYLSELAGELGMQPSSLQRELRSLANAGVVKRQVIGRKVYFQANSGSPVYSALRQIFETTAVSVSR